MTEPIDTTELKSVVLRYVQVGIGLHMLLELTELIRQQLPGGSND